MTRCVLVACLLFCASMLSAETIVYKCEYKNRGSSGWIMKHASYAVNKSARMALIADNAVLHANRGKPITVPVEIRKNGVYIIRWEVNLPTTANHDVDAQYRVRLNPGTLRVSTSVNVADDMNHNGAGKCKAKKLQ